tara:strand:- start:465 stop:713 length:249 start_codon:yes stop_codon:yes gene_type:complete
MLLTKHKERFYTYVGFTNNLKNRLNNHNSSKGAKYTKGKKWIIVYKRKYLTKSDAMKEEYNLKKNKKLRSFYKTKYVSKYYG